LGFITTLIVSVVRNHYFIKFGLVGLFLNGMLSSFIPIPTELTASALLLAGDTRLIVFVVLTSSSIIGGLFAYYIGYGGNKLFIKRFYRKEPTENHRQRSNTILEKYGWIAILASPWIPVFGDVITIAAGAKKYDLKKYLLIMVCGKTVKVLAIVYISSWVLSLLFKS
jgi:membrane protein YqaA with SNARE-associated domain